MFKTTLFFISGLVVSLAAVAAGQEQVLTPADLEYYRVQAFASPTQSARYKLNHIGITATATAAGYRVTAVLDDYPAHAAGVLRGDLLLSADGEPFHPVYSFNERQRAPDRFVARPRPLTLELERDNTVNTISVTPVFENLFDSYRSAGLNSVQEFPSGNKLIGYVRIWGLSRATGDLLALQQIFSRLARCDGIVVDLRDATGFLSSQHLQLLYRSADGLFDVTPGPARETMINAPPWPIHISGYRKPVAVLVNRRTRGGAELLAYQLGKLSRVVSIGETTAGQWGTYTAASDEAVIRYQPVESLTIDGALSEQNGYTPERLVPYPDARQGRIDPQFQAAMDVLMGII